MIGSRFPRILLYALALSLAGCALLLSLFYIQYGRLANQLISTSYNEHRTLLEASFEARARAELQAIADKLELPNGVDDPQLGRALNQAMREHPTLLGLRLTDAAGKSWASGNLPQDVQSAATNGPETELLVSHSITGSGTEVARLWASFDRSELRAELDRFANTLRAEEVASRRVTYLWFAAGTVAILLLFGAVVWLSARDHARRIGQLKKQAEIFRDGDFGEPLPVSRADELGALAQSFNNMRDRLRRTMLSRDYVDRVLSGMNEAIIVTAHDGKIKHINSATTHLLGYEEDELCGMGIDVIIDKKDRGSLVEETPSGLPREAIFASKYGESVPVSYTCSAISGDADGSGDRLFAAHNITEKRRAEKRIRYLARTDTLTKIPNRMQFQHLLHRAIARARRSGTPICLLYVDIDQFKEINDTFGHLAGDTALETVAQRLTASVPDSSVVGRLAGDEFAVIVHGRGPDKRGEDEIRRLAKTILDRLADPLFVQGHEVFMTASIGIAFYPQDAPNVIDLIRNADAALYSVKRSGGNDISLYAPAMNEASVERLMTKSKLKRAFERDELLVHYQPKYNLETGEISGAEALVRWELPERGLILPSDFIPIAEETNLIIEIGEWVLDKVCEDVRMWQRSVEVSGRISVNLSLKQLRHPNFIARIGSIMRGHEVSPTSLELEITETTLMENPKRTIRLLDQLFGLGLHLAIDDFGTGYSSLSALQQFPISTLKIDRSFVRDVAVSPDDATMVDTIIQMGRNLNMDVVAEGVEDEKQLNFLQRLGCAYAQGLLFGDPMSADNYFELLSAQAEGTGAHSALFA